MKTKQIRYSSFFLKLSCFFILISSVSSISADTYFGGIWRNSFTLESEQKDLTHRIDTHVIFQLYSFSDLFTLSSDISISEAFPNDEIIEPNISIDSFKIEFYPRDFMTITFGKYVYQLGQSEFFNPLITFSQINYLSLISGDIASVYNPEFLLQGSIYGESLSFTVSYAPFRPTFQELPTDNPWFPKRSMPSQIEFFGTRYLHNIRYDEISFAPPKLEDYSVQASLSGFFRQFDWTVLWNYGWDRSFPQSSKLTFNPGTYTFDIIIDTKIEKVHSAGLALSGTSGRIRFFCDMLYIHNKTHRTSAFHLLNNLNNIKQLEVTSKTLSVSTGISADIPEINSFFQVEYFDNFLLDKQQYQIELPPFHSILAVYLQTYNDKRTLSLDNLLLISLDSVSFLYYPRLALQFSQEFSIYASFALFQGKENTDFGQYAGKNLIKISCTLKF